MEEDSIIIKPFRDGAIYQFGIIVKYKNEKRTMKFRDEKVRNYIFNGILDMFEMQGRINEVIIA